MQSKRFQFNAHDGKVLFFHGIVTVGQLILIGFGVEHPQFAPFVSFGAEFLRRLING